MLNLLNLLQLVIKKFKCVYPNCSISYFFSAMRRVLDFGSQEEDRTVISDTLTTQLFPEGQACLLPGLFYSLLFLL